VHHQSGVLVVVVGASDPGLASLLDAPKMPFKLFIERPHPDGRHLVIGEVLLPCEDRPRVRDRVEEVARDVL
jgi:hypothetical protein